MEFSLNLLRYYFKAPNAFRWLRAVCLLEDSRQRRVAGNEVMYGKAIHCCTRRGEAALSLPLGFCLSS